MGQAVYDGSGGQTGQLTPQLPTAPNLPLPCSPYAGGVSAPSLPGAPATPYPLVSMPVIPGASNRLV